MGSLQAVPQSPPGLHPRGGCITTGAVAPRGDGKGRVAPKPTPTMNRWKVIAPDDDEDYEPNNTTPGPMTNNTTTNLAAAAAAGEGGAGKMPAPKRSPKISYCYDAASYPLPTSNIPIKRGKNITVLTVLVLVLVHRIVLL